MMNSPNINESTRLMDRGRAPAGSVLIEDDEVREKIKNDGLDAVEVESHEHTSKTSFRYYGQKPKVLGFLITITIILSLAFAITGGALYKYDYEAKYEDTVELWRYFFWALALTLSFTVIAMVISLIFYILHNLFYYTIASYFLSGMQFPITLFSWSILHYFIYCMFVCTDNHGAPNSKRGTIDNIMKALLILGCTFLVMKVFTKAVIAYMQDEDFWPQLRDYIFKEKVFDRIILDEQRGIATLKNIFKRKPSPLASVMSNADTNKEAHMDRAVKISKMVFLRLDLDREGDVSFQEVRPYFDSHHEAKRAFHIFDKDGNGSINYEELVKTVVEIFRDRKELFMILEDRESVADILSRVFMVLYVIIMAVATAFTIYPDTAKAALVPIGTSALALAFIFGNSLKTVWESMLFIFVIKPFSVGDRVTIKDHPTMKVFRMSLFTTVFYGMDGRQFIIPNSFLFTNVITQYKRSRDIAASFKLQVSHDTINGEKFKQFTKRVKEWMNQDQANWNLSKFQCFISDYEETHKFIIEVWAELKGVTWNDMPKFRAPRTRLFLAIQDICHQLGIAFNTAPLTINRKKMD
ncbi:hypothetical protein PROFUN_02341 [Planoprotostelium fungivorum]|uniref:EF-hand domain-containing protein n=1 Tax=Planoprotostelium fungivorum TaxID=1890364 RepID=A0A2P6NYM5_9EUKA|nr:hypothetical protein PROFUN_02341 [Planoprotostelium fungivorum]